jgi:hypothetical protein
MEERRHFQRGTFLVPLSPFHRFEEQLGASIPLSAVLKLEIELSQDFLKSALAELYRLNVIPLTLFPGLDGLARSLWWSVSLGFLRPQKVRT